MKNNNCWNVRCFLLLNFSFVDGMAVDWITNKLYWTDTGDDTISVLDLNTNIRKTLFNLRSVAVSAVEPRAIVIDPLTRLILSINLDISQLQHHLIHIDPKVSPYYSKML